MTPRPPAPRVLPPRLAAWMAGLRVARVEREYALGDLEEDFQAVARLRGAAAARRWYWRQAIGSLFSRTHLRGMPMRLFFSELRSSWRQMLRSPAASTAAILTYALGMGANIAIFSVAWPALLAPLPFPDEDRLAVIWLTYQGRDNTTQINPLSGGDYNDIRAARSFSNMAAYSHYLSEVNLSAAGQPRQITIGQVSASFFPVLGVQALLGRTLMPSDEDRDVPVLVLNERTWRATFGADRAVIGRTVRLDGDPVEIVGVVPAHAGLGTIEPDGWAPLTLQKDRERRRNYFLRAVGRLAPGATRATANDELAAIMKQAGRDFPDSNKGLSATAHDFRDEMIGPARRPLLVLLGGAALVLLVAGINLAGLQVARNLHRAHELGIRQALGASRLRLFAQLVAENLMLALAGGALGAGFAMVTLRALARVAPADDWHTGQLASPAGVAAFTIALAVAMGVAVALIPAWRASSPPRPDATLGRGSTASRSAARARIGIIGAQVALAVVLLIVATLVGTSLARVLRVDRGFRFDQGLVADLALPQSRYSAIETRVRDGKVERVYSTAKATQFLDALVERAEAIPGVTRACVINQVPLDPQVGSMTWVAEGDTRMISSSVKSASPGCYDVLGVPLLQGRLPRAREAEPVVVLSRSIAAALWRDGSDPIGKRVHMGLANGPLMTVVGVVGDIRNNSLERRQGNQVWMPHANGYFTPSRLALNSALPPASLAPQLRAVLTDLDSELALANIRTMDDIVGKATAPRRFMLLLLGGFAMIALVLSAVGIYGVLAHLVGQRAREIGIRRALGAPTLHITRVVAGSTAVAILLGAAAGLAGARALSAVVASLLFEMSATDPRVYGGVAAFVSVAAALAAWPPARRASRVDPLRALRD